MANCGNTNSAFFLKENKHKQTQIPQLEMAWIAKQTLNKKKRGKNNEPVLLQPSEALGQKKAVLQTIGYQHTSEFPQC